MTSQDCPPEWGIEGGRVHAGMMRAAAGLAHKLRAPVLAALRSHDGFNLVVCGQL